MKKLFAIIMIVSAFALLLTVTAGPDGAIAQTGDYDVDDDGLIEITYLEQLNAIRWDADGDGVVDEGADSDGYSTAFPGAIAQMGCPQGGCIGYELARSLDFDDAASYASGAVNTSWTSGVGWLPMGVTTVGSFGSVAASLDVVFDGNRHDIHNLFINRSGDSDLGVAGLFGANDGDIRNVGMVDVDITAGNYVGGLVGNGLHITASYVTGNVSGNNYVGGLTGTAADIIGSYAAGNVSGNNSVGGLLGAGGEVINASYFIGSVSGNARVGGLVGRSNGIWVANSYAAGSVTGNDRVGGLAGYMTTTTVRGIRAGYSIGSVSGYTHAGGLVGLYEKQSRVSRSFGYWNTETSGQSKGIGLGSADGGVQGRTTAELQAPTGYTGIYASWHFDSDNADGDFDRDTGKDDIWDFGTSSQYPVLKVDFNRDGRVTWQEFGNQRGYSPVPVVTPVPTYTPTPTRTPIYTPTPRPRPTQPPIFGPTSTPTPTYTPTPTQPPIFVPTRTPTVVPTRTPTPVADQDVLNRLSALEQLVNSLMDRIVALEERTALPPTATPRPIPTATPTPMPGEPTPTPAPTMTPIPTATPEPPAELSPRAQEIDEAVKAYIEDAGEPATDAEIVSACRHLRGSSWDFFNLPLTTPDRDYSIAAGIFLNTRGAVEIQMYCAEKGG